MKILIGTTEIAGAIDDYRKGYEALDCQVKTIVNTKEKRFKHIYYDYVFLDIIPNIKLSIWNLPYKIFRRVFLEIIKYPLLIYLCLRTDVFHVIWPGKFVKWRYFLPFIKFLNPGLIIIFNAVGSDIRWRKALIQEYKIFNFLLDKSFLKRAEKDDFNDLKNKLETLRNFEKYSDIIYTGPGAAQLSLRPYKQYYLPINLKNISFKDKNNNFPVVVHAATEKAVKGTDLILYIISQLKKENIPHKFLLLYNIPNNKLLKILSNSDIVVYNPNSIAIGKFGLEALASGCILLTGYQEDYNPYPPNPPVITISPENLYETLKYHLLNYKTEGKLKIKGRKWVEKYSSCNLVCQNIINDITNLKTGVKYDYYPTFYRNHYKIVYGEKEIKLLNKYNNFVKNCTWYKKYIKPGERERLLF